MRRELGMVLILILSGLIFSPEVEAGALGSVDPGVSDTPDWRVGDKWIYSGSFDPTGLVSSAGVQANVGKINGDATTTVDSISELLIDNISTLVYYTTSKADFDKGGVEIDTYTGNLYIKYQVDEIIRVSDLATLKTDLSLDVKYVPYGISSLTEEIADITITTINNPPEESYDFPLRDGETWITNYQSATSWSGSSSYISPFPQPTTSSSNTNWEVTDTGKPVNNIGEQIGYGGCNASYELKSYDGNGTETSFKWFCPEVRNYAWSHTEEDIGLVIDFRLKQYLPADSNGVDGNTNPGYRNQEVSIETSTSVTALNTPIEVWANATDSSGSPQSGVDIELRYEAEEFSASLTTASNGSAWAIIDVGQTNDSSETTTDWASHGIIGRTTSMLGVGTITLDENIVGLDLVAALERSSIIRNRSGELTTLNAISGFNILPGDNLTIKLPVYNRGITTTVPTTVELITPDGLSTSENLPALALYEQHIFSFIWNTPLDAQIENLSIRWNVDPNNLNANDADLTNNLGTLPLFIGSLPTYIGQNMSAQTEVKILLDATQSYDQDGGNIRCEFDVPYDDGSRTIAHSFVKKQNCALNWTWTDDGIYDVVVSVFDDESDFTQSILRVEILNRAPKIEIKSQRTEVKVEHPVTLYVFTNDSDSEDPWPGLVDIHWPQANCDEGYYTRVCTTTAWEEGLNTFTAVATDDDGTTTFATIDIVFTNIAPHDVALSMWDSNDEVIKADGQMTWRVFEDQEVELSARAEDSVDDIQDLTYEWSTGVVTEGRVSRIPIVWSQSGLQTINVRAIDAEGEDSGWVERWVDVVNRVPEVPELPEVMAIAEGQTISITGSYSDTISDYDDLIVCWDLDPGADTNGIGSADDDCDVEGANLSWSWRNSGQYNIVFHVRDNDGARNFSTATITVLNLPPIPRVKPVTGAIAGQRVVLDASATIDSPADIETLSVVWDIDCFTDSDGDGVLDNDADLIGIKAEHIFPSEGTWTISAIIWDEDVLNPAAKRIEVVVQSEDRTVAEQLSISLIGDRSNPFFQLIILAVLLTLGVVVVKRLRPKPQSVWQDQIEVMQRPDNPPSFSDFIAENQSVPLPENGLPEGWTMDQWHHYGHQYVESNGNTADEQGQMG